MKPLLSNNLRKLCSQTAWWSTFSAPLCTISNAVCPDTNTCCHCQAQQNSSTQLHGAANWRTERHDPRAIASYTVKTSDRGQVSNSLQATGLHYCSNYWCADIPPPWKYPPGDYPQSDMVRSTGSGSFQIFSCE